MVDEVKDKSKGQKAENKVEQEKLQATDALEWLNQTYRTPAGRLSIVTLPYYSGRTASLEKRKVAAMEKIGDELQAIRKVLMNSKK